MNCKRFLGAANAALIIATLLVLVLVPGAWAQSKYKTLHKFKGGKDGGAPYAGLILDVAGNLYGTTNYGGNFSYCVHGCGTVFELVPNADGTWIEKVLHRFTGGKGKDGAFPNADLIFDQAGNLYGTTTEGGGTDRHGVVFKLTPNSDGSWKKSALYRFTDGADGGHPYGGLILDQAGNLYGTAAYGGPGYSGVVFKLTPNSDGRWTESVLHGFTGGEDGERPAAGLTFDQAGNLYGTTIAGGASVGTLGDGVVFTLTPKPDGSWTERVLHSFNGTDGASPFGNLIFDQAGNLYGTAAYGGNLSCGGPPGCGVVFKLTPNADGSWKEKVLHYFTGGKDGAIPVAGVIFQAGNLYGTTREGGNSGYCNFFGFHGCGVVFKLTLGSDGKWRESVLHAFIDRPGSYPSAGLIFDAAGNLYGTTGG
jgi:hypothetical protein